MSSLNAELMETWWFTQNHWKLIDFPLIIIWLPYRRYLVGPMQEWVAEYWPREISDYRIQIFPHIHSTCMVNKLSINYYTCDCTKSIRAIIKDNLNVFHNWGPLEMIFVQITPCSFEEIEPSCQFQGLACYNKCNGMGEMTDQAGIWTQGPLNLYSGALPTGLSGIIFRLVWPQWWEKNLFLLIMIYHIFWTNFIPI